MATLVVLGTLSTASAQHPGAERNRVYVHPFAERNRVYVHPFRAERNRVYVHPFRAERDAALDNAERQKRLPIGTLPT